MLIRISVDRSGTVLYKLLQAQSHYKQLKIFKQQRLLTANTQLVHHSCIHVLYHCTIYTVNYWIRPLFSSPSTHTDNWSRYLQPPFISHPGKNWIKEPRARKLCSNSACCRKYHALFAASKTKGFSYNSKSLVGAVEWCLSMGEADKKRHKCCTGVQKEHVRLGLIRWRIYTLLS